MGTNPFWAVAVAIALCAPGALPQTPAGRALGAVTAVDAAGKQLTLKQDSGAELHVVLQDATTYQRVAPGETTLKNAEKIDLAAVTVGDRVLARGAMSDDKASLTATSIIVMSKADIAKKHEADRAEWQKRGVAGVVTAVSPESKQVTISLRGRETGKTIQIATTAGTGFRRYAPDSIRFADAKPSSFAELKVGDNLRALGAKSEDGTSLAAEEIVSGSFRNVAATVISVDAAAKTIKVTDLDTKKPLLVRVKEDSTLRMLPEFAANMLAMRLKGGGAGGPGGPGGPPGGMRPGGGPGGPGGGQGGPPGGFPGGGRPGGMGRGPGGGGPPDLEQMLERMPPLELAALKSGDPLIIASTTGSDPAAVTAITILGGVEPLLRSAPKGSQGMVLGNWNLSVGVPQ
jgi:hypothetical protein